MNRTNIALTFGCVLLMVSLVLVVIPEWGCQPIGMAIAVAVIAGFGVINIVVSQKQYRSVLREVTKVDDRVSRVEYRTQPVHDIRGTVAKTSTEVRESLRRIRILADEEGGMGQAGPDVWSWGRSEALEHSIFAPNTIRSSSISHRPKMHIPGRDAARQDMKVPGEHNLARILLAPDTDMKREIAYVGGVDLISSLELVGSVTVITPGMGEKAVSDSAAYIVVDLDTFAETAWRGVLDASKTRLYQELHSILASARKRGTVVILHGEGVPSHFTVSLEKLAHVRIQRNGPEFARWGNDVSSEVMEAIVAHDSRVEGLPER